MRKENDLPSSIEAEKAVLGSIILEPTLWDSLSVEVAENDFIDSATPLTISLFATSLVWTYRDIWVNYLWEAEDFMEVKHGNN